MTKDYGADPAPGEIAIHERVDASLVCAPGVIGYRAGLDRNEGFDGFYPKHSHTYAMMADGGLWPMCGY